MERHSKSLTYTTIRMQPNPPMKKEPSDREATHPFVRVNLPIKMRPALPVNEKYIS